MKPRVAFGVDTGDLECIGLLPLWCRVERYSQEKADRGRTYEDESGDTGVDSRDSGGKPGERPMGDGLELEAEA